MVLGGVAHAQPRDGAAAGDDTSQTPVQNRINLRLGGSTGDSTGRPTICVDVAVAAGFGVEACGTGQGVIHDEPGQELTHFRGHYTVFARGRGRVRAALGFAELQVGVDHPGFSFGEPDALDRGSVAGPEAAVQAQWLVPLGKGIEGIASFTAGAAVFADADQLITPQSNVQPFASLELGVGW